VACFFDSQCTAVLFLSRPIGFRPASSVQVSLFLNVGSSESGIVVVLDGASLGGKHVSHSEWHPRMTLADMLVTISTQSRRVAAVHALVWLQALTHSSVPMSQKLGRLCEWFICTKHTHPHMDPYGGTDLRPQPDMDMVLYHCMVWEFSRQLSLFCWPTVGWPGWVDLGD